MMNFQSRLLYLRTEHRLSQSTLASMLGVTRQTISRWETGVSYPELSKLPLLCRVLHTTPGILCAPPSEALPPITTEDTSVAEIDMELLSEGIRSYRTAIGLSQEALGEKLSVTRQTVSRWETAQMLPDMDKLLQMLPLFEVDADTLLTYGKAPIIPCDPPADFPSEECGEENEDAPTQPLVDTAGRQPTVSRKHPSKNAIFFTILSVTLLLVLLLSGCALYVREKNTPQISDVFSLVQGSDLRDIRLSHKDKTACLYLADGCERFDLTKTIQLLNGAAFSCEGFEDPHAIALAEGEEKTGTLTVTVGHRKSRYTLTISRRLLHTVSFENTNETFTVVDGETCPLPSFAANRAGYVFEGWLFDFENTPITADTTIAARWTPLFTVTFEGSDHTESVKKNACLTRPDVIPQKEGFAFAGWDFDFDTPILQNTHITAFWYPTTTLYANGGTVKVATLVRDGSNVMPETPTRPGYTFGGWFTDAALTKPLGDTLGDHAALYAHWKEEALPTSFTYETNEEKNGVIITGLSKSYPERRLQIPAYIGGLPVLVIEKLTDAPVEVVIPQTAKSVGIEAFANCQTLEVVLFNGANTAIGDRAFLGCTSLRSVNLPSSLALIDFRTFEGCTSLKGISIPSTVLAIRDSAFEGCTALSGIRLPYLGLDDLGAHVFKDCTSLSLVTLGTGSPKTQLAAQNLFEGCTSLKEITLPDGLTTLPSGFFSGCSSLEKVNLPKSLKTIGSKAFYGCTALSSIDLPSDLETIEGGAFYGCSALSALTLTQTNLRLAAGAFENCTGLVTLTFPSSFSSIGDGAFKGCTSLKSITLPSSASYLGQSLFENCTGLEEIVIPAYWKTLTAGFFKGCTALKTISLPSSLDEIGEYAFENCKALLTLTLPKGVSAATNAFRGCDKLTLFTK